ncbi:MAG: phosphatase PAP2 family protein [Candidatus Hodarchaeota archaeon]
MESKQIFDKVDNWDRKIVLKYNGFGGKTSTFFLKFISFFGRETIWLLLMWYYFFVWYDPLIFSFITTTFILGLLIIAPVKKLFERARPFETLKEVKVLERKPTSRSFPSWHAYNVTSQGLLIGYFLNSLLITIIIMGFTVLVAFSRIQLGVHYPSDVIAGYLFGIFGFLLSVGIFAPLLISLISIIEFIIGIEIYYRMINIYLFQNVWYFILCIGVVILIILFATFKRIKEIFIKS